MSDAQCVMPVGTETRTPGECREECAIAVPRGYMRAKAAADWACALALTVVATPIVAGLGLLLKCTSRGPVFYTQSRLGLNGKTFQIYKLRTMTHMCEADGGPAWSVAGDPRVTRVGRWLRDTHLDELPQLLNVLRGEMSLIGPRPERPEIAERLEQYVPRYRERLGVRPGITGLAQVRLPPDSGLESVCQKLAHDLAYMEHMSPWLDARIAVSTVLCLSADAANLLARRLVWRFVPTEPIEAVAGGTDHGLKVAGSVIGQVGPGAEEKRYSRAA